MTASHPSDGQSGANRSAVEPTPGPERPIVEINEALRNDWIEIWYQPKIDLRRKCLAGAEALARIRHPGHGVLPKGSFLPRFDEDGIAALTERALIATLRNWSEFDEAGVNLHLAINVPVSALFKLPIHALVREHGPAAAHWPGLILEITEDQIVRHVSTAHAAATDLRANRISISIDDFGAGYSSFACLRELPFAEIKIDRSFVTNCATDATNAAICQTVIDLAHRFGGAAVAEGLENPADLQAVMVMGCDFGQGALIGPPLPKQEFIEFLRKRMHRGAAAGAKPAAIGQVA